MQKATAYFVTKMNKYPLILWPHMVWAISLESTFVPFSMKIPAVIHLTTYYPDVNPLK